MNPDERTPPDATPPPHLAPHLAVVRFGLLSACGGLVGGLGAGVSAPLIQPTASLANVLLPASLVAAVCAAVVLAVAALLARVERLARRLALTALLVPAVSAAFLSSIAWFQGLLAGGPSGAWVELLDSLQLLLREPLPVLAFAPFGLLGLLRSLELARTSTRRALIEVGASGALGLVAVGVLTAGFGRPPSGSLLGACATFAIAPAAGMLGIHLGAALSRRLEARLGDPD